MVARKLFTILRQVSPVNLAQLDSELRAQTFSVPFFGLAIDNDGWVEIQFLDSNPTPTDEATVDYVIAAHVPKAALQVDYDNLHEVYTYKSNGLTDKIEYFADDTQQVLIKRVTMKYKKKLLVEVKTEEFNEFGVLVNTFTETIVYEKKRIKKIKRYKG